MSNLEVSFFNQREQTPESYTRNDLIQYVSAPCGSGKTYAICTEIADTIDRFKPPLRGPYAKALGGNADAPREIKCELPPDYQSITSRQCKKGNIELSKGVRRSGSGAVNYFQRLHRIALLS